MHDEATYRAFATMVYIVAMYNFMSLFFAIAVMSCVKTNKYLIFCEG